jgi:hypothetical protein
MMVRSGCENSHSTRCTEVFSLPVKILSLLNMFSHYTPFTRIIKGGGLGWMWVRFANLAIQRSEDNPGHLKG